MFQDSEDNNNNTSTHNDNNVQLSIPLSTSMPAYSKLNRRRRITCRKCSLPFGYVTMSSAYIEADLSKLNELNKRKVENYDLTTNTDYHQSSNETNLSNITLDNRDKRYFLSIFLPDAINIYVKPNTNVNKSNQIDEKFTNLDMPHTFDFGNTTLHDAYNVYCVGCDTCLGVRYEPCSSDFKKIIKDCKLNCSTNTLHKSLYPDDEDSELVDQDNMCPTPNIIWGETPPSVSAEDDGWITISLEYVTIEPLFGLVGLDQFSIRYEGGEMNPQFFRSIESNSLLSQNSATWIIPSRRLSTKIMYDPHKIFHQTQSWGKTYYDLEIAEKAVPNTTIQKNLIQSTIRNLCPIYGKKYIDQKPDEEQKFSIFI